MENLATRRLLGKVAQCLLLVAALAVPSMATRHPVPLDPNTDSAKCVECHQDKTKGPSVHTAISMGCNSCHEVRVIKSRDKKREDVTRVKLIKATATGQCLTCHEDLKGGPSKSRVHAPVMRNCLTCHDPHVSKYKNQLLKPAEGGKDENLCLNCHSMGLNVPKDGSRHAALDMGCATCHTTHKIGAADQRDNQYHLTKDSPALCKDCHDPSDDKLKKAHHNQPIDKADCLTCHDPHQSRKPKLAQFFQHSPFEGGACESCHADAKDGKVVLTNTDTRALCVSCHEDKAKEIASAKVQHPGAQGECTACHNPHASRYDRLMNPDPVKVCENCHAEQAEMHKTKPALHTAAFRDGCFTCHNGHGSDLPKLLRAEGNRLCLECHSPRRNPKVDQATGTVNIFNNSVRLPASYFARMPALDLNTGDSFGHPTATHPVIATIDRSDPNKKRSMTCLSCHAPHASTSRGMLVTEAKEGGLALCNRCHADASGLVLPTATEPAPGQQTQQTGKKGKKK